MADSPPSTSATEIMAGLNWAAQDTTLLAPQHLARPRPLRAWERRPASRMNSKTKVWKRAAKASLPLTVAGAAPDDEGAGKRRRLRQGARASSPVKIVKRLCLGPSEGVGMRWEGVGSPQKRIVTRSLRQEERLVELGDHDVVDGDSDVEGEVEEEEDVEGTIVELLNEDGTVVELEEGGQKGWEDEDEEEEEEEDGTMVHLGDAVEHEPEHMAPAALDVEDASHDVTQQQDVQVADEDMTEQHQDGNVTERQQAAASSQEDAAVEAPSAPEELAPEEAAKPALTAPLPSSSGPIPAGFVSPVKRHRSVSKRLSMATGRRRTLPRTFAPEVAAEPAAVLEDDAAEPIKVEMMQGSMEATEAPEVVANHVIEDAREPETVRLGDIGTGTATETPALPVEHVTDVAEPVADEDDAWEDVPDELPETLVMATLNQPHDPSEDIMDSNDDSVEHSADPLFRNTEESSAMAVDEPEASIETPPQSPKSIQQTIPNPSPQHHQELPLRRSPRRKSSSPVKQRTSTASKPHLVAFTPVKRDASIFNLPHESPASIANLTPQADESTESSSFPEPATLRRSVSAPPEEPAATPRAKVSKPRVSDDTALLQAFINRANDRKKSSNSVNTSDEAIATGSAAIARRESLENRRDSNTVRLALASPGAKSSGIDTGVLGDLDPNSPSPRKASGLPGLDLEEQTSTGTNAVDEAADKALPDGKKRTRTSTRRSARTTTLPDLSADTGPNRISLRGNAEQVVLRGSDAQELARTTKSNTRKNKGGSVMPILRLTKLAAEKKDSLGSEEGAIEETSAEGGEKKRKRGIAWDEQLVYYQDAAAMSSSFSSSLSVGLGEEDVVMEDDASATTPAQDATADEQIQVLTSDLPSALKVPSSRAVHNIPPPPAETPSKPKSKVRKLKTLRTAASALTTPALERDATAVDEQQTQTKPNPRVLKRSRIATPAKSLLSASANLSNEAPAPPPTVTAPGATERTKLAPKRRVLSRLPAPASSSAQQSQQDDSSRPSLAAPSTLTASPAKKKPSLSASTNGSTASLPALKNFAPKLDFSTSLSLSRSRAPALKQPSSSASGEEARAGLASPAKKMGSRSFTLPPPSASSSAAAVDGEGEGEGLVRSRSGREGGGMGIGLGLGLGLGSPAKKRGRRG